MATAKKKTTKKPATLQPKGDFGMPFKVGDAILIRTVTMIQLGRVGGIAQDHIVLVDAGWVADTGRFGEALSKGTLNEFERAPSWIMVPRSGIVDIYPWAHAIPQASK